MVGARVYGSCMRIFHVSILTSMTCFQNVVTVEDHQGLERSKGDIARLRCHHVPYIFHQLRFCFLWSPSPAQWFVPIVSLISGLGGRCAKCEC
jgi:hypothetical protein